MSTPPNTPRIPPGVEPLIIPLAPEPSAYPLADVPPPGRPWTGPPPRAPHRKFLATILIAIATALSLGHSLRTMSQFEANDISRWCTVWSLLERGTYAIDDCPWQSKTQDKVRKPDKLAAPAGGDANALKLKRFEYALAPRVWKEGEPVERFYSSKPPLLPTLIAGLLYPARKLSGVPLDAVVKQTRAPRYVPKPVPAEPGKTSSVLETPEPALWPAYVFYFKPVILLLNVLPALAFLVLYARLCDRVAGGDDWSWTLSLFAAAVGTYLFTFQQTLNNHTIAATSAFFALYALQKIAAEGSRSAGVFAAAGFFATFCACNEIPALLFVALLFLYLFARFPVRTFQFFLPAALVPGLAFLATQFVAFGQFKPVYEEFGTKSYNYEGSYWNTPLEMDWFNGFTEKTDDGRVVRVPNQEPYGIYLFHMTLGHHGVFSLSPIFVFSIFGAFREIFRRGKLSAVAWLTVLLTVAMFAFYTWNPKARNYGGSTQGLRWLFWLIPFWLAVLPTGLKGGAERRWVRWVSLSALFVSALSVGYALRNPWSHPWILDAMEHLDVYRMVR